MYHALLDSSLDTRRKRDFIFRPAIPVALDIENVAGCQKRTENFFHKEGIALGQGVEGIRKLPVQKTAHGESRMLLLKDSRQHGIDIGTNKRRKSDLLRKPFARELGKPVTQRGTKFITAICDQQKEAMRTHAPRQIEKKVKAGIVAPMDILDNHKHRGLRRQMKEKPRQYGKETPFLLLWFKYRWAGHLLRHQFREQGKNLKSQRIDRYLVCCWRIGGHKRAQEVEQRRIGAGKVRRKTTALKQQKIRGALFCLSNQARFSNSCFTTDQNDPPLFPPRPLDELLETLDLVRAPNYSRAGDRQSHGFFHRSPSLFSTKNLTRSGKPLRV